MQTFLQEVAGEISRKYKQLNKVTIVFPNRRAVIYFRKHLGEMVGRPVFAPRMITIEDFFGTFTSLKVPDKLLLVQRLYHAYHEVISHGEREAFDKFYFWGEMLLRDFEEIDKYLLSPEHLFKDLSVQKELDASFDFLTDEQRSFLQAFWSGFESNITENKGKFLTVWNRLLQLYQLFRERLTQDSFSYEGMRQRVVVENLDSLSLQVPADTPLVFAGFNALTRCEEHLLSYFVEKRNADIYWDIDAYYVNNNIQEAGRFFREYQRHDVLGKTFQRNIPSNFSRMFASASGETNNDTPDNKRRDVHIYGAPDPVSQTKLLSHVLQQEVERGLVPQETLIVLPDEKLLLPVLHGLSPAIEKLNVTMGFPLSATPIFTLAELLVDLQIARRHDHFNHRQVLALLGHPYVVAADPGAANEKRKEILKHNWINIPASYLASGIDIHRLIFREADATTLVNYLRDSVQAVGALNGLSDIDKEYAFGFLTLVNQMDEVMPDVVGSAEVNSGARNATAGVRQAALKSFLRLLRQLVQSYRIPFAGEPLRGLQVMGVLETRNLDYKNVFVMSLNEGVFPGSAGKGSYIPFNIRKAYGLPTVEHQDAMYAYLFYRMLQRAENIHLFYNSETDVLGQGEMSRYLQQLIYESGLPIRRSILHNPIQPRPSSVITVAKSAEIMEALFRLSEGNANYKGISPSALNAYLECRLRFYLRHVARIREANEVEEDLDARILGNFLHGVMEMLYNDLRLKKGSPNVERADLDEAEPVIEKLIDRVFIQEYRLDPAKPVEYAGQRVVVREVVRQFAHRIIANDRDYAPFVVEGTEQGSFYHRIPLKSTAQSVLLSGKIDRVDRKGDVVRIIDYKTGKDQLGFDGISSLFSREGKRNKAAFQTMLYALLYHVNTPRDSQIVPGLINRLNLFDRNFQFGLKLGNTPITDARPLFPEFEMRLEELVQEIFVSDTPFDQTTNTDICKLCEFKEICYR